MDNQTFIQQKFAEFYEENASKIEAPSSISQREFGFMVFKENVMVRHKRFGTADALKTFIKESAPAHAYHSTAYYETPEAKMEDKGWLGADLYFDIDADHIATKCKEIHDSWTCKDCGFAGKGQPDVCPSCGSKRFDQRIWPCDECLDSAKKETIKLVEMLMEEFGFSSNEVAVSFSGHRGYHVHVTNEVIRELDAGARKEIVDYITGTGLNVSFFSSAVGAFRSSPETPVYALNDVGWRGRIVKGAYEFLSSATLKNLIDLGIKEKRANEIVLNKEAILNSWKREGPWRPVRGVGKEELRTIIDHVIGVQSVKIDTMVTTDIHRLIRLPNTLHGKTGWLKVSFPFSHIDIFDPFKSAVAFKKGTVNIYVEESPKFRIGDEWFGEYKKQKVELPTAAAIFVLCKDSASLVE
ncbi:DNA primase small subunit PriS [Candidatus Bathyarchaeota archaeon]|nr:DNA primase small subunit PriS [Candidatus Bathyarchaeota archaeon]